MLCSNKNCSSYYFGAVFVGNAQFLGIGLEPFFPIFYHAENQFHPIFPFAQSVKKQRTVRLNRQTVLMGGIGPVPNHFLP